MSLKLKSATKEAADCRKAFKNSKVGDYAWHCHHEVLFEKLDEPAENRITYILHSKEPHEQALRLRLFRPAKITKQLADKYNADRKPLADKYNADLKQLAKIVKHQQRCPCCPWNGQTIFPK